MSETGQPFLFFMKCPELKTLLSFSVEVIYDNQGYGLDLFHRRILKCRELVFSEPELVATPAYFSKNQITAVISKKKFYSTGFQQKLEKMSLKISRVDDASPVLLQECLQYTVVAKIAPQWNSVQNLLVQGRDFLMVSDSLRAINLDISVNSQEITLCVKPTCIKLPQFKIENYLMMHNLSGDNISIEEKCHVLPSLKTGKATSLSRSMLATSAFKNYTDLKKHWKNMYGYRLPEIPEQSIWYFTVTFNLPFSTTYTYPSFCVRPFGMTTVPRVDPELTLRSFIQDFCKKVNNVCNIKCQILDLKASFPLASLYPAQYATEDMVPKLGTTYTVTQNVPYKSSSESRINNEKWFNKSEQSAMNLMNKTPQNCTRIITNDLIGVSMKTRNVNTITYNLMSCRNNILNKREKSMLLRENQCQNQLNSSQINNMKSIKQSDIKNEIGVNNITKYNNCENKMVPYSTFGECILQKPFQHDTAPEVKFAPHFPPKKQKKEMRTLILTDIFPKVKSTKYAPNFNKSKIKSGSMLQSSTSNSVLKRNNLDLKPNLNLLNSVAVSGDCKTPTMNTKVVTFETNEFSQMYDGSKVNIRKRRKMDISTGDNKTEKLKNKTFKVSTRKAAKV